MTYIPDQVNYRGYYRGYDPNGNILIYQVGDVVTYRNKNYIAVENIKDKVPTSKDSGWEYFESQHKFVESSEEPVANIGDRWRNLNTGRTYTRIQDENGFHWVEL
jgi:NMD protein affecting ribosome stability and mRNA decay